MFIPLFKEQKNGKFLISHKKEYKLCGYQYGFFEKKEWIIPHNGNTKRFFLEVIIDNEIIKNYNLIILNYNTIKLEFSTIVTGYVNILLYNDDENNCKVPFSITLTPTPTPTPTPTLPLLSFINQSPVPGIVGQEYYYKFVATGGITPYSWTLAGSLPTGLNFDEVNGVLSGIPEESGEFLIRPILTDSRPATIMGLMKKIIIYEN